MAFPRTRAASSIRRENLFPTMWPIPGWAHPEFVYAYDDWKQTRHAIAGEKEIKAESVVYLPAMESMDDGEYLAYLDRATYYNFSGQTLQALNGTIFRRNPVISGLPERMVDGLENISINNESFVGYSSGAATELLALGRVGVLLDLSATPSVTPKPYFVTYTAEHIVDWDHDRDPNTGRARLTRVALREVKLTAGNYSGERKYVAKYRVLELINGVYTQSLYEADNADADITDAYLISRHAPERRGVTLDFIPFTLFTPSMGTYGVEKSALYDIIRLNLSHYRSYAQLEQGRFFTGFPIYYAEIPQGAEGGMDYELAPSRVWEVPAGSKPGLLEFYGQGLAFLEKALDTKEHQAAALGGRIIGIRTGATSESNNSAKMAQLNEHATLLIASRALDKGFTELLRLWAWWSGLSKEEADKISVEFNKDFLFSDIGSREFRAIHALYKDGIIPIEVVYEYLKKALVIPDWMSLAELKKQLDTMDSFPHQPNIEAMHEGFPDKKTQLEQENLEDEQEMADEAADNADPAAGHKAGNRNNGAAAGRAPGGKPGRPPVKTNQPAKT